MAILTKEEKKSIINNHIRNLEYIKYGYEIDVLQENAKSNPSSEALEKFSDSIDEVTSQLSALNSELSSVEALTE